MNTSFSYTIQIDTLEDGCQGLNIGYAPANLANDYQGDGLYTGTVLGFINPSGFTPVNCLCFGMSGLKFTLTIQKESDSAQGGVELKRTFNSDGIAEVKSSYII